MMKISLALLFLLSPCLVAQTIDGPFTVIQGDIILGPASAAEGYRTALATRSLYQVITGTGTQLWTNSTMYYVIDADVPNPQRILDGIAHWNTKTQFQILPRTSEKNYVRFQRQILDASCNSYLGMIGGEQIIGTTDSCSAGSVIHELGHAWGLWHEHQRADRGGNLTVLYDNMDKRYYSDFNQSLSTAKDSGYYDFDSIMHYSSTGFSRNYRDTLETVPPGIPLGQRTGLSAGDIDGATRLYKQIPAGSTITTAPAGLNIRVDGVGAVSPQTYNWSAGSSHTVTVDAVQGQLEPRYLFAKWSDGGALQHTVTASPDLTVFCANFIRQHTLQTGVASGQGKVTVFPATLDGYLAERQPFIPTAVPGPGSQFIRWTGSTFLSASGASVSALSPVVQMGNGASNYQGTFTSGPVTTIDSKPQGATVIVDGTSYLTPVNLAWAPGTSHTLSYSDPQIYGNNTSRLQFLNWENAGTGARTVVAGTASVTYTAAFNVQYRLSTNRAGSGTITAVPSSADGFYDAGTPVQLTAAPATGQILRYWVGDLAGGAATTTVMLDQQRDVAAVFGTPVAFRVLSAASLQGNPVIGNTGSIVAPGQLVAIFGTNIGPTAAAFGNPDANGKLPTSLGGVTVLFDAFPAPLVYAGPNQINAVVPYGVAGQTSSLVRINSAAAPAGAPPVISTISVGGSAPAMFTYDGSGQGQLAALNQDGTVNSPGNPAPPGSVVVLYGTGAGLMNKALPDGQILISDLAAPVAPLFVRFGKLPGELLYAGSAPYLVNGVLQINVRMPADLIGGGAVPVQLIVGAYTSPPGTTISVGTK